MNNNNSSSLFTEMKQLFVIAFPLMLSELVDTSFNFTSTIMAAHLSIQALAAAGLVTSLFVTIMVFMWGILIAVCTLTAQQYGAKDMAGVSQVLKDGLWLAIILSIPGMILIWNLSPILLFFGQKPDTILFATHYLHALTWTVLPDFCATVLLQFIIGLGNSKIALFFSLIRIPITLFVSYILMFGKFNLPVLGIAGLGWGMSIGMWFSTILLIAYILWHPEYRKFLLKHFDVQEHYYFKILKIGLPIAGMFCIEVGFFTMMSLILGQINSTVLAAHQITTQFTGFFTVIISFCYAQAATIRIGNAVGRGDFTSISTIAYAGVIIAIGLMFLVALCYWVFPHYLIAIDLDPLKKSNKMIIHYATQFFAIAALVQIFEAIRIVLFGALRGMGKTRFSMLTSLFVFWIIAFPIGYVLTIPLKLGGRGMWIGMAVGTLIGAILLFWWLRRSVAQHLKNQLIGIKP